MSKSKSKTDNTQANAILCVKQNRWVPVEKFACSQPDQYCQHRTSCVIWELTREQRRSDRGRESRPAT